MNKFCRTLKRIWNSMVWKPQLNCEETLWRNKPDNRTPKNPNQFATISRNQDTIETSAFNSNEKKTEPKITRIVPLITTITKVMVKQTLNPAIKFPTKPMQTMQTTKLTTPQRNVTLEQTQRTDHLLGIDGRKDKTKSNRKMLKATQMEMFKVKPNR